MSKFMIASEENQMALAHHGILGMRWGVRRDRRELTPYEQEERRRKRTRNLAIGAGIATAAAVGTALAIRGAKKRRAMSTTQVAKNIERISTNTQKVASQVKKAAQNTPKPQVKKPQTYNVDLKKVGNNIDRVLASWNTPSKQVRGYGSIPKYSGDTAKTLNLLKTNSKAAYQYANRTPKYTGATKEMLTNLKKIRAHR